MPGELGTTAWMAPEMFRGGLYDESVDVYSFGIVLWELLTLAHPHEGVPEQQLVYSVMNGGVRPPVPLGAPGRWVELMTACWDEEPRRRPSAAAVEGALAGMDAVELAREDRGR